MSISLKSIANPTLKRNPPELTLCIQNMKEFLLKQESKERGSWHFFPCCPCYQLTEVKEDFLAQSRSLILFHLK